MLGKLFGKGKDKDEAGDKKGGKKKPAPEEPAAAEEAAAPAADAAATPTAGEAAPVAAPTPEAKAVLRGGGDASPLADTSAAIEAARKAAGEDAKVSVAFGAGEAAVEAEAPTPKKKKKQAAEDEAALEDEHALPKKKRLPLQLIMQSMAAMLYLILIGVVAGLVMTSDPPPKPKGHLVEFEMPEPGKVVGMAGAPGVLPPPEPEYGSLEPISPDLLEESPHGYVPKIAEDGREPWQYYAARYRNPDKRPRIALMFINMGLSRASAEATIGKLPSSVSFAFQPYARETERYMDYARAQGHETFIQIPLEPSDHPNSDPGPHVLLTKLAGPDNVYRLEWALSRSPDSSASPMISATNSWRRPMP